MSCGDELPSDLVPIKDVNDEEMQIAARFAVEMHNKSGGHC